MAKLSGRITIIISGSDSGMGYVTGQSWVIDGGLDMNWGQGARGDRDTFRQANSGRLSNHGARCL